jgi:hypothetical protein
VGGLVKLAPLGVDWRLWGAWGGLDRAHCGRSSIKHEPLVGTKRDRGIARGREGARRALSSLLCWRVHTPHRPSHQTWPLRRAGRPPKRERVAPLWSVQRPTPCGSCVACGVWSARSGNARRRGEREGLRNGGGAGAGGAARQSGSIRSMFRAWFGRRCACLRRCARRVVCTKRQDARGTMLTFARVRLAALLRATIALLWGVKRDGLQ